MAPWRACDGADTWDTCKYYFKKESKSTPGDAQNLCARNIPPYHIEQDIFTHEIVSCMREGIDLALCCAIAWFKRCKTPAGSHTL